MMVARRTLADQIRVVAQKLAKSRYVTGYDRVGG